MHAVKLKKLEAADEERNNSRNLTSKSSTINMESRMTFFYDSKTVSAYGWLDLIINGLLPFSICQSAVYKKYVKYSSLSLPTIMSLIGRLTKYVEAKIRSILPSKLALALDGWNEGAYTFHIHLCKCSL